MQIEGLVGFSYCPQSIISKAARFFRKDWMHDAPSHTFLIAGKIGDELLVIESTTPQARIVPISKLMEDKYIFELWHVANVDVDIKINAIKEMMRDVTTKYAYLQLVGFIWVWFWNKLKREVSNPFKKGLICSEFVYKALQKMGYKDSVLKNLGANNIAPDHILASFKANKYCSIVAVYRPEKRLLDWLV